MAKRMRLSLAALIIGAMLAACGPAAEESSDAAPTAPAAPTLPPPVIQESAAAPTEPPAATEVTPVAVTPVAATATADPALAPFVGTYHFRPDQHDLTANYYLTLRPDGTAEIDEQVVGSTEVVIEGTGTWTAIGPEVILSVDTVYGEPVAQEFLVRIVFNDGFPVITDAKMGDQFIHIDDTGFNIGAGERSALIIELNRRLAAVPWLTYTDPGTDLYTEEVRQAVVAFQQSQGLWPDGVLTAETWQALENPAEPLPEPTPIAVATPIPTPGQPITTIPDLSQLPDTTDDGKPILYLTFDDGPLPENTPGLLEVLAKHNAVVTFFNLGQNVVTWPDMVRDATTRGHYIANHTWDHASMEGMTPEQFVSEVQRTSDAIFNAAGDLFTLDLGVRYVRPPYGATDANTRQYAANQGMAVVLWDIDTQDWRQPGADVIAGHLTSSAFPGAIVLMHDGGSDRSQTIAALDAALPQLAAQGYVFRNIFLP